MNYLEVLSTIKHEGINRYKNAFNADSIEDLVQQGELLALEALEHFHGDYNSEAFRIFSQKTIIGGLATFVLEGDVEIPASTRYEYNKILKTRDRLKAQTGLRPTIQEIATAANVSVKQTTAAIQCEILMIPSKRIDQELDEEGNTIGYYLKDPNNPIEESDRKLTNEELHKVLEKKLEEMELLEKQMIISILEGKKLCEIAKQFGKSENYARIIRKKAFRKLRKDETLKDFFEKLCA